MKLKNRILPGLAALGLIVAIIVAVQAERRPPPAQPVAQPAQAPFKSYIGGAGLVEASSNNIDIGTGVAGIVQKVLVKVGEHVAIGTPLFQIDDRDFRAALLVKQANVVKARAAVEEAKATLEDARSQYALVSSAGDQRAVSLDDVQKRRNAELLAKARLESAHAAVTAAEADVKSTQIEIERLTVRAPIDGEIMQVNIRPGEFAQAGVLTTPLIKMGNLDQLYVRVNIDENDAWRFKPQTAAAASLRGNRELKTPLSFVRVEPYVTPKQSLTGASTERVDTRVLQVLYSFPRNALPAFVGQQMDVFIETPEIAPVAPAATQSGGVTR
ncbi:MAG: efflux RND transporter periplasmic adaptor subunit [Proteobacteria bacterium]|nr:efflux RND transporter periplasmic adaptor subunit [Pseudomonadota bacterium]